MGKKQYVVESEFEDLHGNPADEPDLELDVSDSDNPIIKAALEGADKDWTPPEKDEKDDEKDDDSDEDDEEEDVELDDEDEDSDEEDKDSDDEEDDEDEDEEDDKYSKNVQKRIDRERELRRQEKAAADAKMRKLERKIELRDAKDDLRDFERDTDSKLRKLRKQKVEALEEDEAAKAAEIDEEIMDLKVELRDRKAKVEALEKDLNVDDDATDVRSRIPVAGQKFLDKYPEFHTNQSFHDVVLDADKMVARRGLDKNTAKYYEEIEKIVAVQFPEIVNKRTVKVRKRRKKPAVGGTTKPGTRHKPAGSRRKGVIRLTKADQEQMRNFGLDPKNPVHAKEWAANKSD